VELLLPKDAAVEHIIHSLREKVHLSEKGSQQIRLMEILNHRIVKVCQPEDPISNIAEYCSLLAEASFVLRMYMLSLIHR
jgi:hypothetical protein